MLMTTPAFAADYNFETPSPKDYYGSTSYEEVYGAQYNYGGINAVDFLDPLADGAPVSTVGGGSTVEYGINAGNGSIYPDSSSDGYPIQWGDVSTLPTTQFTSASEVKRSDGSIGTLVIPSLGIRYKAYEGTDSAAMRNGVGHFPSTSAWGGNIGLCGHNRGSSHNIGSIKNLDVGDTIRAAFDGKVRVVKNQGRYGYGKYVVIRHDNGLETLYGHLSKQLVKPDQLVKAGEPIALGGNTGRSTGSHLHFETRFLGKPLNPALMFDFEKQDIVADTYTFHKEKSDSKKASSRKGIFYKVKRGDTLSKIAQRQGTTVSQLCKLNRITRRTVLRPGQVLRCS